MLKVDDLPEHHHLNIDAELPFDRRPRSPTALTHAEIADVIAFLARFRNGSIRAACTRTLSSRCMLAPRSLASRPGSGAAP